ncbi:MAG: hypothetical protein O3A46_05725 [Candidatus Poribacteria bacterium]|nr:hypothetical protein [Candidatus Poribacteria bacterium]
MTNEHPQPLPNGAKFDPPLPEESLRQAHADGKLLRIAKAKDDVGGVADVYVSRAVGERFGRSGVLYLLNLSLRRLVREDAEGRKTLEKGVCVLDAIRVVSYGTALVMSYAEEPIP